MTFLNLFFCFVLFHAVSGNETLGGDSSVHSTYVQYVDGSPDSALYAATNGQMYFLLLTRPPPPHPQNSIFSLITRNCPIY
jgi:hypothetical protein